MVSQEKAMQLLEEDELKIVFLKYSFDAVEKVPLYLEGSKVVCEFIY